MLKPSELLSQPDSWTQCCWARDAQDLAVGPTDQRAVRWCALGAIEATSVDLEHRLAMRHKLETHLYGEWSNVTHWNDAEDRTQEEVVQAFKDIGL